MMPAAGDWIVRAIEWRGGRGFRQRRGTIMAREARRACEWNRDADDLLDDAGPAFHGVPFVSRVTA
jgi:hypothetical protein